MNTQISVTLNNVTPGQFDAITKLLAGDTETATTVTKKTRGKGKTKPETTVSEDEEESFGTRALKAAELEETEEETEESQEEEEAEEETDSEEDEPNVDKETLKAAINKFGEKKPKAMLAIYSSVNVKTWAELVTRPNKWDAVYAKVKAQLKAMKK